MIVIAILDNAFESKVTSVQDTYCTRVCASRRILVRTPVLRQAERTTTGIGTLSTNLKYSVTRLI